MLGKMSFVCRRCAFYLFFDRWSFDGTVLSNKPNNHTDTGRGLTMAIRFSTKLRGAVVKWAENQPDAPQIPAAVRRLVEVGLAAEQTAKSIKRGPNAGQQARASEMAGNVIDDMIDGATPNEDKVYRKQRLIKGPDEFQKLREDRQNSKKQQRDI